MTLGLIMGGFALFVLVIWRVYATGKATGEQNAETKRFIDEQGTLDAIDEFNRAIDERDAADRRSDRNDDGSEPWVRRDDRDG